MDIKEITPLPSKQLLSGEIKRDSESNFQK